MRKFKRGNLLASGLRSWDQIDIAPPNHPEQEGIWMDKTDIPDLLRWLEAVDDEYNERLDAGR